MPSRQFIALLAATLAFRAWLALAVPITGDEAYFVAWGRRPDWGYYDHPPMVGWWLAALLQGGDDHAWLRLPALLQPALLALTVFWALPRLYPMMDTDRREMIALLVLLAPVNVWNVLITTDTPLVLFSVLSGLAWLRAAQERPDDGLRWYLLAGLLLAGAVLSKYFVAFLGVAYLADVLLRRSSRAVSGLLVTYACTLPALALMAWWNAGHCWPNLMFNFINRHTDAGASLLTPPLYLLTTVYVLGPPVVWLAWRRCRPASADFASPTLTTLAWLPFLLFALLSPIKRIGLHWLLSFVPFALLWVGLRLPLANLRTLGHFFVGFAALHVCTLVVISRLPLETWQSTRFYDGIVLSFEHDAIAAALRGDDGNSVDSRKGAEDRRRILAMDSYSSAATLGYALHAPVAVFGPGSYHAREDDSVTDYRALDGKNFLILKKTVPDEQYYRRYFRHVSSDRFTVRGADFWRLRGDSFDYAAYRDEVLAHVRDSYYRIPAWLPQTTCPFCQHHFGAATCRL